MFNNVGTVEHYYSTGKFTPGLLKPDEPKIGITDATVTSVNGNLFCKFTREKYIDGVDRYCNSSKNSYYLLIAEGAVSNGNISTFFFHFSNFFLKRHNSKSWTIFCNK